MLLYELANKVFKTLISSILNSKTTTENCPLVLLRIDNRDIEHKKIHRKNFEYNFC